MVDDGRWLTVSGPKAFCANERCDFFYNGDRDTTARQALYKGREHARATGHEVHVERGQLAIVWPGDR